MSEASSQFGTQNSDGTAGRNLSSARLHLIEAMDLWEREGDLGGRLAGYASGDATQP